MSLTDVYFLTYYMRACSFMSDSFAISWSVALQLLCPWDFPDKNTVVGCHAFLQGIFLTQGSNMHLCVSCIGTWIVGTAHHPSPVAQSCLTLCDPMDSSPPGSSVHGTSQTRIL